MQNHNDTIIKTDAGRLLYKYMYLSLYCKGSKRVTHGLRVRGSWRPNRTAIYWPHSYGCQRCVFLVLQGCSTGGPGAHSASFLYCILSATSLDPNSSGPRDPKAWCGFPYHISSITRLFSNCNCNSWLLSWLCYIIVQRPLCRLLDFWNRMLDHHQAEITVMQFTGHSLPVHQSMSVPWEFFFYLVPFHQPISAHAISSHNCHQNVSLPSGASLRMAFLVGSKVKMSQK